MVQSFWSLEQVPDKKTSSYEDRLCEQFFVQTTKRDQEGRYIVRIPFKPDEPELGNSESIAHRRFMSLERRLEENPDLKKEYSGVISRHIADGHLEIAPEDSKGTEGYVLPHHGVVKDSESTRLRVVFDGSCRTSNGRSLNDTIFPGPKLHNDLVGILLRFRINKIAMAGDIKQMFCQIRIAPEDRKYQKLLWRFDKQNPISCYQHTSVVFGLTSSPFLSMRTLLQLVEDEGAPYPEACKILKEQIFVDDFVFSVPDKETALDVYEQLTALLKKGQFEIKKWISSSKEVLSHIPIEDQRSNSSLSFDGDKFLKVLGLSWNVATDCFSYQALEIKDNFTKRGVLSSIARIFDPLGWLSPVTLVAKLVLKELWAQKLDWDTPLPEDVIEKWSRFGQELSSLSKIGINRSFVGSSSSRPVYHLHGFSDASCKAYGCATYLVVEELGKVTSFLLLGKSRVTPQNKSITLPRLEMQAAVLLAQMVQVCLKYFNNYIEIAGVYCWTDSTVTLHWINSSPVRWHTFVANRVSDIQENTSVNWWHYVSTEENPADIASRGMEPNDLVQSRLWWHGPPWLSLEPKFWPLRRVTPELPENSELESKVVKSFALNSSKIHTLDQLVLDVLVRSSTLLKLQRATAYCYRGITPKKSRPPGPLKTKELSRALKFWLKVEQNRCFSELIHALKKNKEVPKSFVKLSPYLDADGLIRVGGRLSLPHLNEDKHHPILVPCKSKLSECIVKFYHESFGHLGVSALHASVQQRFWIPSGRRIVRSVIFRCINCFKSKPRFPTPFMAALPSARTTVARAFEKVGVDFCGPVFVKPSNLRKAPKLKAYIAVFTCMTTKATHLESTTDLTTSSFLAALDRFVSRRGLPSDIFSDNGSNFRGADNELRQFFLDSGNNTTIADKLSGRNIQWHFNPPYAPHFGGVWESMVKSVKNHLVKTIGDVALTFEELYTVLTRVEAALNSRPITAISSDPNDFGALTPGHFLIMQPLVAIPTSDPRSNSLNHLQRWELVKRFQSLFWKRWSIEYLTTLESRSKWTKKDKNLAVGTLIIVKEDNLPPLSWKLGRVIETFPGKDKQVRAANVKIPELLNGKITFGVYKRPVVKLAPLPIDIQC